MNYFFENKNCFRLELAPFLFTSVFKTRQKQLHFFNQFFYMTNFWASIKLCNLQLAITKHIFSHISCRTTLLFFLIGFKDAWNIVNTFSCGIFTTFIVYSIESNSCIIASQCFPTALVFTCVPKSPCTLIQKEML